MNKTGLAKRLLPVIADSLQIPQDTLQAWCYQNIITIHAISHGWRLTILGEPAGEQIMAAHAKRLSRVVKESI